MLLVDAEQKETPQLAKKSILFWDSLWGGGREEDATSDIDHQQLPKAAARTVEALNRSHSNRLGAQPQIASVLASPTINKGINQLVTGEVSVFPLWFLTGNSSLV